MSEHRELIESLGLKQEECMGSTFLGIELTEFDKDELIMICHWLNNDANRWRAHYFGAFESHQKTMDLALKLRKKIGWK